MSESPEYIQVELPFIQQLQAMGWDYLEGDTDVPYLTERENFRQVLLTDRLREAIARINLDENGEPWLDEARINQVVSRLECVIPDYAERQRWLKEHGGMYDL